jgi:hypothetical protein
MARKLQAFYYTRQSERAGASRRVRAISLILLGARVAAERSRA